MQRSLSVSGRLSFLLLLGSALVSGCYEARPSAGGGQTSFVPPRLVNPADVAVPAGYRVEAVATGLTFPTGVAVDDNERVYVVESGYSYGEVWTTPRLVRIDAGKPVPIAAGTKNGPWNGVAYRQGAFYVAEGGELEGGRILRITPDGQSRALVENLPSVGDHHTNGPAVGPDGMIYFGQGTATNSGVVGEDNAKFGWLKRKPAFHDVPCQDVVLAGKNFDSTDVVNERDRRVSTGAFLPFGSPSEPGQRIQGQVPCTGAIMRVPPEGGAPQLVAWGLRNPFGLAFAPDGKLYVTENGYDDRGSRPVWGAPDVLWQITPGLWYGWPDYAEGRPLTHEGYKPPLKDQPSFLLERHPNPPPKPAAVLGVHASSNGFDFSRSSAFGHVGEAFIAEFGDQAPDTGKVLHPVGFRVVRVDTHSGKIEDFMVNKADKNGPASRVGGGGIERPVAARFNPAGTALYVVDFGVMLMDKQGPKPQPGTGVLWRVTRDASQ